jgi:transposase
MNTKLPEGNIFAGLDWSDAEHAVCLIDGAGNTLDAFTMEHTHEKLDELVVRIGAFGPCAGVAIERTGGLVVHKLLQAGVPVYAINPKVAKTWRDSHKAAGSKTDAIDAFVLADGLRHFHKRLRPLVLDQDQTRELALLCDDESALIAERTAKVNRLRATLKEYHPEALKWFTTWTSPAAWDFVLCFPSPDALASASRKKLTGFLKTHRIAVAPLWQERIDAARNAERWPRDAAVIAAKSFLAVRIARQLRVLQAALDDYRQRIQELFDEHPDKDIFSSLPGAGPKLGPRLLTLFGSARDTFASAQSVQALSGVVPVTIQSGNMKFEKMRRACDKDARKTMFQFAACSLKTSRWAKAYYQHATVTLKQSHARALRNLGAKWLKIIYRMWQSGQPYDETLYIASLIAHNSPLVALMNPL